MTSERQIAANRRNARKSTGPKSLAGKKRTSRNSWKHGLATSIAADTYYNPLIEEFARKIAGKTDDMSARAYARVVAAAHLEIDRARRIRVGLIEGAKLLGSDDQPSRLSKKLNLAESICRALPTLTQISRYELRATAKRDKAVHRLLQCKAALEVGNGSGDGE